MYLLMLILLILLILLVVASDLLFSIKKKHPLIARNENSDPTGLNQRDWIVDAESYILYGRIGNADLTCPGYLFPLLGTWKTGTTNKLIQCMYCFQLIFIFKRIGIS